MTPLETWLAFIVVLSFPAAYLWGRMQYDLGKYTVIKAAVDYSFDAHADEALQLFVTQPVEKPKTIEEAARNLFLGGLITSEEYHRVVREELN